MSTLGALTIAAAAVVVALCAPAAAQAPDPVSSDARAGVPTSTPAISRTRIVQAPSTGFQWGDAAIGSAATLALILLAAGGAMTLRPSGRASPRDRTPRARPPP